jgi:hypothetical protein
MQERDPVDIDNDTSISSSCVADDDVRQQQPEMQIPKWASYDGGFGVEVGGGGESMASPSLSLNTSDARTVKTESVTLPDNFGGCSITDYSVAVSTLELDEYMPVHYGNLVGLRYDKTDINMAHISAVSEFEAISSKVSRWPADVCEWNPAYYGLLSTHVNKVEADTVKYCFPGGWVLSRDLDGLAMGESSPTVSHDREFTTSDSSRLLSNQLRFYMGNVPGFLVVSTVFIVLYKCWKSQSVKSPAVESLPDVGDLFSKAKSLDTSSGARLSSRLLSTIGVSVTNSQTLHSFRGRGDSSARGLVTEASHTQSDGRSKRRYIRSLFLKWYRKSKHRMPSSEIALVADEKTINTINSANNVVLGAEMQTLGVNPAFKKLSRTSSRQNSFKLDETQQVSPEAFDVVGVEAGSGAGAVREIAAHTDPTGAITSTFATAYQPESALESSADPTRPECLYATYLSNANRLTDTGDVCKSKLIVNPALDILRVKAAIANKSQSNATSGNAVLVDEAGEWKVKESINLVVNPLSQGHGVVDRHAPTSTTPDRDGEDGESAVFGINPAVELLKRRQSHGFSSCQPIKLNNGDPAGGDLTWTSLSEDENDDLCGEATSPEVVTKGSSYFLRNKSDAKDRYGTDDDNDSFQFSKLTARTDKGNVGRHKSVGRLTIQTPKGFTETVQLEEGVYCGKSRRDHTDTVVAPGSLSARGDAQLPPQPFSQTTSVSHLLGVFDSVEVDVESKKAGRRHCREMVHDGPADIYHRTNDLLRHLQYRRSDERQAASKTAPVHFQTVTEDIHAKHAEVPVAESFNPLKTPLSRPSVKKRFSHPAPERASGLPTAVGALMVTTDTTANEEAETTEEAFRRTNRQFIQLRRNSLLVLGSSSPGVNNVEDPTLAVNYFSTTPTKRTSAYSMRRSVALDILSPRESACILASSNDIKAVSVAALIGGTADDGMATCSSRPPVTCTDTTDQNSDSDTNQFAQGSPRFAAYIQSRTMEQFQRMREVAASEAQQHALKNAVVPALCGNFHKPGAVAVVDNNDNNSCKHVNPLFSPRQRFRNIFSAGEEAQLSGQSFDYVALNGAVPVRAGRSYDRTNDHFVEMKKAAMVSSSSSSDYSTKAIAAADVTQQAPNFGVNEDEEPSSFPILRMVAQKLGNC